MKPLCELKSVADLATVEIMPVILIDTREQDPLPFKNLKAERATLKTGEGDYSYAGARSFGIERKSIADLVMSVTSERERFFNSLHGLSSRWFKRLLVIGSEDDIAAGNYRSKANPKSVLASLYTIEARYGVPVVFAPTPEAGALLVERWAYYSAKEQGHGADELVRGHNRYAKETPGAELAA